MSADAWCDHCDMSLVSCPHGAPPPPPPAEPAPRSTGSTTTTRRTSEPARTPRSSPARSRVPGTPAPAPVRRAPVVKPGRTPQPAYRPYLLAILADHDGRLERERVLDEVGRRMADVLQPADLGIGPSGEVRWRTAALKERRALGDAGMVGSGGPGLWELTTDGYATLKAFRAAQEATSAPDGDDDPQD